MTVEVSLLTNRGDIRSAITQVLHAESRPRRVRILTFSIGSFRLESAVPFESQLKKLLAYGSEVTVVIGENPLELEEHQVKMLRELSDHGARLYHRRSLHAKLVLAEGVKWRRFFLGSANMTSSAMETMDELGVRGESAAEEPFAALTEYFNRKVGNAATKPLAQYW